MILHLPPELHVNILTFLRANDLSSLQRTCRTFNDRNLIHSIIDTFANTVYPPELSHGFDTPAIGGEVHVLNPHNQFWTYEALRNMEMLVVARILSRPEPPKNACCNAYYVSKNWCRATLKWLEVQAEERKQREQRRLEEAEAAAAAALAEQSASRGRGSKGQVYNGSKQSKKKNSKKQERKNKKLSQKLSGVSPPPLDVNHDITCEHGCLKYSGEGRSSRTSRRLLDRQAWKVLKKLYPQGAQLSILDGECLQCAMEVEMEKRNEEMKKQRETKERKMPLTCPLVRGIYSRRTGVPKECLLFQQNQSDDNLENITFTSPVARLYPVLRNGSICPLVPGVYNVIPKAWCHRWRKYIKNGEGERPPAPDTSVCLCDAHRLPLIPPHLESFLYGETASLMETTLDVLSRTNHDDGSRTPNMASPSPLPPPGYSLTGDHMLGRGDMETLPSNQHQQPLERIIGGERIPVPRQGDMIQDEISNLRASGVSESEIQLQRLAMLQIEDQRIRQREAFERRMRAMNESPTVLARDIDMSPEEIRAKINAQLDRENKVVVEIITDEELEALEKWWPGIHSSYSLKFAVVELDQGSTDIVWTTPPCTYCDASGKAGVCDFAVRNRNRNWVNNTPKKRFGK